MVKSELAVGCGLLVLLSIIFNPWNIFMPGYVVMVLLIGAIVLYVVFAIFLWRENRGDEREAFHRLFADRIAYLAGSALLLIGIIVDELQRVPLDPWLVLALAIMVIAKVGGLIYSKMKL
jgi:hypothetical protein